MNSVTPTERLGYRPALDGLRGIAICGVLACHLFGRSGRGGFAPGGFFGVDLFFVLSGFLITTLLLEEREATGTVSLRGFWMRRVRRLLPAAGGLAVVFLSLMGAAGRLSHGLVIVAAGALYAGNIVQSVSPHFGLRPLAHFWSLAEEEQFYVVWPPLLLIAFRRRLDERRLLETISALALALAIYRVGLGISGSSVHRIYFAPDTHADGLVLGCASALFRRRFVQRPSDLLAAFALVGVATAFFLAHEDRMWLMFGLPAFDLTAAVLVLAAATPTRISTALGSRPLVWLGAISYSLYVWHQLARWLLNWQNPWVALTLSLCLAIASHYFLEQPFRNKRNRRRTRPINETLVRAS